VAIGKGRLLDGAEAAYDRDRKRIYFSNAAAQDLAHFYVAHEFAHHWLGELGAACGNADINPLVPSEPEMSSVGDEDSYSPKERAEAQANLFAREFLLPRDKLRERCSAGVPDADVIAHEIGVPCLYFGRFVTCFR
jgi:Zn-dependent peptidase ImmA (M78 family)